VAIRVQQVPPKIPSDVLTDVRIHVGILGDSAVSRRIADQIQVHLTSRIALPQETRVSSPRIFTPHPNAATGTLTVPRGESNQTPFLKVQARGAVRSGKTTPAEPAARSGWNLWLTLLRAFFRLWRSERMEMPFAHTKETFSPVYRYQDVHRAHYCGSGPALFSAVTLRRGNPFHNEAGAFFFSTCLDRDASASASLCSRI